MRFTSITFASLAIFAAVAMSAPIDSINGNSIAMMRRDDASQPWAVPSGVSGSKDDANKKEAVKPVITTPTPSVTDATNKEDSKVPTPADSIKPPTSDMDMGKIGSTETNGTSSSIKPTDETHKTTKIDHSTDGLDTGKIGGDEDVNGDDDKNGEKKHPKHKTPKSKQNKSGSAAAGKHPKKGGKKQCNVHKHPKVGKHPQAGGSGEEENSEDCKEVDSEPTPSPKGDGQPANGSDYEKPKMDQPPLEVTPIPKQPKADQPPLEVTPIPKQPPKNDQPPKKDQPPLDVTPMPKPPPKSDQPPLDVTPIPKQPHSNQPKPKVPWGQIIHSFFTPKPIQQTKGCNKKGDSLINVDILDCAEVDFATMLKNLFPF